LQCDRQQQWTVRIHCFFALSSDQTDAFSIQALPLLSSRILGCAASFPPHVCILWIDLLQSWFCFIIPFLSPPSSSLTPFYAPLVCVLPSWSRIYASFFMHLTRYMIHVFRLLYPHLPRPPLISFFSTGSDSFTPVLPPLPGFRRWDRRGLRVARRVVVACVLHVCNVRGLQ